MTSKKLATAIVIAVLFSMAGLSGAAVADPSLAGPPSDRGVQPEWYANNPQAGPDNSNCGYFDPSYQEFRINSLDSLADGIYSDGYVSLDIDVTQSETDGPSFDWSIAAGSAVQALPGIFVKGGDNGNWYDYSGFTDVAGFVGASHDGFLHSPVNQNNGKFYGLSHVSFCYEILPDAYIEIEADDTNAVGDPHTFIITVWEDSTADGVVGDFELAAGEWVDVTYAESNGADAQAADACITGDGSGLLSDGVTSDLGKCEVTINSQSAGQIVATASSDVEVDGYILSRSTDGIAPNSGPATKTYVDAYIEIAPDDVNLVGLDHTFTVTVWENAGDGAFVKAAGELVNVTYQSFNGADAQAADSCTTGTEGTCTVTVNSAATGQIVASASSNVSVGGLSLYRETDGIAPNSGSATKTYVDARISIAEDDDNVVGESHTFTIKLERDLGDGDGFVAFGGQDVSASLSGVGFFVGDDNDCTTAGDGTCTVSINSSDPGQSIVSASFMGNIVAGYADTTISISTDGAAGEFDAPAVKTWWDGRITLTPDYDINGITEAHMIYALVEITADGTNWQAVEGADVDFALFNNAPSAYFVGADNDCDTDASGTCYVEINADQAGSVDIGASSSLTVAGIDGTFYVETDPSTSNDASTFSGPRVQKEYVDASLFWLKQDHLGQPLEGATFEVQRTFDRFGNPVTEAPIVVLDNSAPDADPDEGEFLLDGLEFGTYTIKETAAPEGYFLDDTVITVDVIDLDDSDGIANNGPDVDVSLIYIWVNTPGRSQLTPTNYECQAFYDETAPDLVFTVNRAGNVAPGRFFFYNLISYSGVEITFDVMTSTTGASEAVADGAKVWIIDEYGMCQKIDAAVSFSNNDVQITIPAGLGVDEVIFRVEYKSPKGDAEMGDVHTFETYIGANLIFQESIKVMAD